MFDAVGENYESKSGQVTVGHLLMMVVFVITVEAVIFPIRHAGGGLLRYVLGIPLGLAFGVLVVRMNWTIGKFLWTRSRSYSARMQNALAIVLLALDFVWMAVGAIGGSGLGRLLVKHVA